MDQFDQAQELAQRFNDQALAVHKKMAGVKGTGSPTCLECGEPIPKKRREAVPGCELCVDCQADLEGTI